MPAVAASAAAKKSRRYHAPTVAEALVVPWVRRGVSIRSVASWGHVSVGFVHRSVALLRRHLDTLRSATGTRGRRPLADIRDEPESLADGAVRALAALAPRRRGPAPGTGAKITDAHRAYLLELLRDQETAFLTIREFAARLVRRFRGRDNGGDRLRSVSRSTVSREVFHKLGFTCKKAQRKNCRRMTPANAARYRDFVTAHFDRVDEDVFGDFERECGDMCNWMPRVAADMVLFTDESGFNLQCTRRSTGRAPRGKRLFVTGADDRGPGRSHHLSPMCRTARRARNRLADRKRHAAGRSAKRLEIAPRCGRGAPPAPAAVVRWGGQTTKDWRGMNKINQEKKKIKKNQKKL
jgi:transposase